MTFEADAELSVSVSDAELRRARQQIEDELPDVDVGVSSAMTDGGALLGAGGGGGRGATSRRRQRRGFIPRTLEEQAESLDTLVDLADDRNRILRDIADCVCGDNIGGGGEGGPAPTGGGGGGGGFGGLAELLAGVAGGALLGVGAAEFLGTGEVLGEGTAEPTPEPAPDQPITEPAIEPQIEPLVTPTPPAPGAIIPERQREGGEGDGGGPGEREIQPEEFGEPTVERPPAPEDIIIPPGDTPERDREPEPEPEPDRDREPTPERPPEPVRNVPPLDVEVPEHPRAPDVIIPPADVPAPPPGRDEQPTPDRDREPTPEQPSLRTDVLLEAPGGDAPAVEPALAPDTPAGRGLTGRREAPSVEAFQEQVNPLEVGQEVAGRVGGGAVEFAQERPIETGVLAGGAALTLAGGIGAPALAGAAGRAAPSFATTAPAAAAGADARRESTATRDRRGPSDRDQSRPVNVDVTIPVDVDAAARSVRDAVDRELAGLEDRIQREIERAISVGGGRR